MAWAMLPRAIWLGSRRPLPAPPLQLQSIQPFLFPEKRAFSSFGASLGADLGAAPSLRATGAPRTALESCSLPRRRRVAGRWSGGCPCSRDAASRRRRGPRTNERDRTAAYIYNHRRLEQLRQEPAPGSIDWTRRASATEIRGNLGVQHQFARHLQKHRRAGGRGRDCNWAPQRRPCFPRGLLLVTAPRNSGTPRCAYAQCPKVK